MKELFDNKELTVPSRISWYWKDLVFSFDTIDPAFLFTVLQMLTFGNIYFREYAHYTYAFYISKSPVWGKIILKNNLNPEDICSAYGLFALPYLYAYSFGYKEFNFEALYDIDISRPYVIKYIHKLFKRHNWDIPWILINYKYIGNITENNKHKFNRSFSGRKFLYSLTYNAWKQHLLKEGLWHETKELDI